MRRRALAFGLLLAACSKDAPPVVVGPSPSLPWRHVVAVKGDWGAPTREHKLVTDRMCEVRKTIPFTYVLTTGDNFYGPDGVATQKNFYEPERCLTGVKWRATWGNHDVAGDSTATVLGSKRFYTWSYGDIAYFALDSNRPEDAEQRAWLERSLSRSTARVKIAYFHHPPYTASIHKPDFAVRRAWVPLFERHGVALVLSGHNHDYEHSVVKGIHYIVSGGGGARVYPCIRKPVELLKCDDVYHFLLLGIEGGELVVRAIRGGGGILDTVRIAL